MVPAGWAQVCRKAVGPCDEPEYCDGIHPDCPADVLYWSGYPCGPQSECSTDVCSGTSPSCPLLVLPKPASVQCGGETPGQMGHCSGGANPTCIADPCGGPGQACCASDDPYSQTMCKTAGYGCTLVNRGCLAYDSAKESYVNECPKTSAGVTNTGTCVPCGDVGQPVCRTPALEGGDAYVCTYTTERPSCSEEKDQHGTACTCIACGGSGQPVCTH